MIGRFFKDQYFRIMRKLTCCYALEDSYSNSYGKDMSYSFVGYMHITLHSFRAVYPLNGSRTL